MKNNWVTIKNKKYQLPMYLPDGTLGVVRNLDSLDLAKIGIDGVVVNTYHLMSQPGVANLKKLGGIKKLMNFDGLVTSDSGGWQVFSLIHRKNTTGKITDEGVVFSIGEAKNTLFTPELSIQTQFDIGADLVVCLDDFTPPDAEDDKIWESVERTILWAKRSRREYDRIINKRELDDKSRPHLLAVIQGGWSKEARKYCAEKLIEIGFDAYGFGGYVIRDGILDLEIGQYVAELIPDDKLKFALGFGRPHDIASLFEFGWEIFDCTLPTRDARHKRLYNFKKNPQEMTLEELQNPDNYEYNYLRKTKHEKSNQPISKFCDCHTCGNFSLGYLFHLFDIGDFAAHRLAMIHNLRTYQLLINRLKELKK